MAAYSGVESAARTFIASSCAVPTAEPQFQFGSAQPMTIPAGDGRGAWSRGGEWRTRPRTPPRRSISRQFLKFCIVASSYFRMKLKCFPPDYLNSTSIRNNLLLE